MFLMPVASYLEQVDSVWVLDMAQCTRLRPPVRALQVVVLVEPQTPVVVLDSFKLLEQVLVDAQNRLPRLCARDVSPFRTSYTLQMLFRRLDELASGDVVSDQDAYTCALHRQIMHEPSADGVITLDASTENVLPPCRWLVRTRENWFWIESLDVVSGQLLGAIKVHVWGQPKLE